MADAIYMRNMPFFGRHGVFPEEQKLGQRFVVSVILYLDLHPSAVRDDLTLTVNYGDVYNRVQGIVQGEPCKLLETIAERICQVLLRDFPVVSGVRVQLEKPGAPIEGIFSTVGVELERSRTR